MKITDTVPTYNGNLENYEAMGREEFGAPLHEVHIDTDSQGVLVTLGAALPDNDESDDLGPPQVVLERRPNGWLVFVMVDSCGNEGCSVYVTDDRRCLIVPGRKAEVDVEGEVVTEAVDCLPQSA